MCKEEGVKEYRGGRVKLLRSILQQPWNLKNKAAHRRERGIERERNKKQEG